MLYAQVFPGLIADVLPAGNFFKNKQAEFVAGVEKMRRLRIMRRADDVAFQLFFDYLGILPLPAFRHRLADIWIRLVAVEAAKLDVFAVEVKPFGRKFCFAETDTGVKMVYHRLAVRDRYANVE